MSLDELIEPGACEHVAHNLGISREHLSRIKNGKIRPGFELALRISAYFKGQVSVEELMGPAEPFPLTARLRACDPPVTTLGIIAATLERHKLAAEAHRGPLARAGPEDPATAKSTSRS